jgi:hypothetical protein
MDFLPQEIINRAVLYLDRYPTQLHTPNIRQQSHLSTSALPPYATISKQWKEAVEFVTFHRLNIKSDDLGQLRAIVTNNRCKYVRRLSYTIVLPAYSKEQGRHIESKEEQAISNGVFTQGIVDLFSILSQWEEAGLLSGLRFKIEDPESPSDTKDSKSRWDSTYLSLSADERIPTVSGISYLQIQGNYRRKTSPAVAPGLAAFLPGLKHIYGEFYEAGERTVKIENRARFAKLLAHRRLTHVTAAEFDFHQEIPEDHRIRMPSLLPPGASYDPFSTSLRVFSQNLTSFVLNGYVDSTLFWPSTHETCSSPSWPSLKKLKIGFNPAAPSGDWYFVGTPTGEPQFLEHASPNTMDPFLTAFTKATQQMPVLDKFMLECAVGVFVGMWEVSYYAPGVKADWSTEWGDEDTIEVRRLYWSVGDVWRPDKFVSETLRSIGQDGIGSQLIERFLGSRNEDSDSAWSQL